jgi:hypothetical protein
MFAQIYFNLIISTKKVFQKEGKNIPKGIVNFPFIEK